MFIELIRTGIVPVRRIARRRKFIAEIFIGTYQRIRSKQSGLITLALRVFTALGNPVGKRLLKQENKALLCGIPDAPLIPQMLNRLPDKLAQVGLP